MATLLRITTDAGDLELAQGADRAFFITRQIHDLNSWETRNADFTATLEVPATPANIAILDAATNIGGAEEGLDNKIQCSIYLNGITVAPVAFLLSTFNTRVKSETTFSVTVFYNNFNLFDKIGGDDIADLNWADLAIQWETLDLQSIATNTTDIVFPICDWNTRNSDVIVKPSFGPGRVLEVNACGFFLYAKEIMQRIVTEAGFTLIVDPSVPSDYHLIALACPVTKFLDLATDTDAITGTTVKTITQTATGTTENITFQTTDQDPSGLFNHTNNEWLIPSSDDYYFEAKGIYDYDRAHPQNDPSRIVLYQNLTELAFIDFDASATGVAFFLSATVSAIAGDILYVVMEASNNKQDATLTITSLAETTISNPGTPPNRTVQPSQHIPQIDQGTFFSNILKLFNLLVITDDVASTVTLMSFDVVYTNKEQDLSRFLAAGPEEITKENYLASLGQNSHLRWGDDNLLRRNANFVKKFNNQILNRSVDVLTMDFSACDNSQLYFFIGNDTFLKAKIPMAEVTRKVTGVFGDIRITTDAQGVFSITPDNISFEVGDWFRMIEDATDDTHYYRVIEKSSDTTGKLQTPIGFKWVSTSTLYQVVSASSEDFEPRLAIIRDDGGAAFSFGLMQGAMEGSLQFPAGALTANWMDSLKMSEIANTYYKNIFDSLSTPQVIKAKFNLAAIQVLNFDFTRPVYVSQFNAFYYCNKINKYKINGLTELELVRISQLIN